MTRGEIIVVSLPGDFGKPRPAVVVQSDAVSGAASLIVCPLTTSVEEGAAMRPLVHPSTATGLRRPSRVMVDKVTAVTRARCRPPIGRLDRPDLEALNRALAAVLGLTDESAAFP